MPAADGRRRLTDPALGPFLRRRRRDGELSLRQLATRAGVSNPYLSQIERGLRRPSAVVLARLASALGLRPEALYERAGLLPAGVDVVGRVRSDPTLTEAQKQALVDTYLDFRRQNEEGGPDGGNEPTPG